jgi:hypothetical protein
MKKRDCGTDLSSIIHQTWKLVDMAEIELHVLMGQCLNRRIEDKSIIKEEIEIWQEARKCQYKIKKILSDNIQLT